MFHFSIFTWLKSRQDESRASRRQRRRNRSALPRQAIALRLETLEDRSVPSTFTVTSLADSGPGTLRAGVASGADTIRFAAGLHGTISLASEIAISSNLTIDGPGANRITVSGDNATRVFDISGGTVTIAELRIAEGLATSSAVN